ncbi:hypothetical protein [Candidatus Cetobacterium colombiensis]|uniref:Uncharacterized protein n=1 Tax=Candidatus Cetobacterium colombiensis TaxID=3073100 RepID=A0ABU4WEB5_9FUSO|nr:hypothetical protein [Candidatus Cetobacterium colombiensis]MDX8336745.1 hypothetical protein [Candidatus Cetobacterium colombiensis]
MKLKKIIILKIIFTVVLIKVNYKFKTLNKYVKVSTKDNPSQFKVLKIERR